MSLRHWPIGETPHVAGGSYLELCPSELTEPWPGLLSSPNMEAFFLDWPEDRLCIDTLLKQPDGTFPRRPSVSREANHVSCLWSNWAGLLVKLECLLFPEEDVKPVPLNISSLRWFLLMCWFAHPQAPLPVGAEAVWPGSKWWWSTRLAGAASPQACMLDVSWLLDNWMLFAPLTVKLAASHRVWMMLGKL